jgi:hypothetical protein
VVELSARAEEQAAHFVEAFAYAGKGRLAVAGDDVYRFSNEGVVGIVLVQELGERAFGAAGQQ